jgi:hypothetical protein
METENSNRKRQQYKALYCQIRRQDKGSAFYNKRRIKTVTFGIKVLLDWGYTLLTEFAVYVKENVARNFCSQQTLHSTIYQNISKGFTLLVLLKYKESYY